MIKTKIDEKKDVGLPNVFGIITGTEFGHDECPIAAFDFIHEQTKHSYFRQYSPTLRLLASANNYDRNEYFTHTTSINRATKSCF